MFQRVIGKRCEPKGYPACDVIVDSSLEICERCGGSLKVETGIDKKRAAGACLAVLAGILAVTFIALKVIPALSVSQQTQTVKQTSSSPGEASISKLLRSVYSDGVKDQQERAKLEEAVKQFSAESQWVSQREEQIKNDSNRLLSGIKRGLGYAASEDYTQAEREFRYCLEIDPESSPAWTNLAVVHIKTGHLEQAKQACDKAVSFDPQNWLARYNLGSLYAIKGDKDNALRELSEALRLVNEGQSPKITRAEVSKHIKADRSFGSLQNDRRFQELITRN